MRAVLKNRINNVLTSIFLGVISVAPLHALADDDYTVLSNAIYVAHASNDGDSFRVRAGEETLLIRLYYVDCPETVISTESDMKRLRSQSRHFGITNDAETVQFGHQAAQYVQEILSKPFTVYTAYAQALGRSKSGRVYAFVKTHDARDLASLLVAEGYARSHGVGRATPDGFSRDEEQAKLADSELAAAVKKKGIWSASVPDRIVGLRAQQREEDEAFKNLKTELQKAVQPKLPLNINTATDIELQKIKGIGPVLAQKIIQNRPYKTLDELLTISGIGPQTIQRIAPYLTADDL